LDANWDGNSYLSSLSTGDFIWNSQRYTFGDWKAVTGFDKSSSYLQGVSDRHKSVRAAEPI